jgi:TRAP-type C4-dicarboxylate transport system substrate-binding protein
MKIVRSLVGAAMAAALPAMALPAWAQPVSLTIASPLPIEHTSFKAMEIFKAEVARRTHNAISVELAPGQQLGSASEVVQKGRAESIFGFWIGASYMTRLVPETAVINLPFVFSNYHEVMRTIDGPAGRLIEAKLDTKGFTTLAWMELGARHVANSKRPLKTVDDFKNLRLFAQPAETFQATFRALGADPRVIPPWRSTGHCNGAISTAWRRPIQSSTVLNTLSRRNTFPTRITSWTSSSLSPTKTHS